MGRFTCAQCARPYYDKRFLWEPAEDPELSDDVPAGASQAQAECRRGSAPARLEGGLPEGSPPEGAAPGGATASEGSRGPSDEGKGHGHGHGQGQGRRAEERRRYLPRMVNGVDVLVRVADGCWRADNTHLQAETVGLGFRKSMDLGDKDGYWMLPWGQAFAGEAVGSSWVACVLQAAPEEDADSRGAAPADGEDGEAASKHARSIADTVRMTGTAANITGSLAPGLSAVLAPVSSVAGVVGAVGGSMQLYQGLSTPSGTVDPHLVTKGGITAGVGSTCMVLGACAAAFPPLFAVALGLGVAGLGGATLVDSVMGGLCSECREGACESEKQATTTRAAETEEEDAQTQTRASAAASGAGPAKEPPRRSIVSTGGRVSIAKHDPAAAAGCATVAKHDPTGETQMRLEEAESQGNCREFF